MTKETTAKKTTRKRPALDRYRVPILDRTLDLLELLSTQSGALTVTELTTALRMPKNSVFRIATTLTLREYAERDEDTKAYRATGKLLSLGHAAVGGQRLVQAAAPVLSSLRNASGETALLGTLAGSQGTVLDQVPSPLPVKVVVEIGHAFPLHTAAPAKAMLAYLEPGKQNALIKQIKFTKYTQRTIASASAYRRELEEVKTEGYAIDRGEESDTFACVAAPVFDHRGSPVAALWVSGPSDRVRPSVFGKLGKMVQRHAALLSRSLGSPANPGATPAP
jgi:DNA-binding IclR family transcriptional regulator